MNTMEALNIKDLPEGYPPQAIWRGKSPAGYFIYGFPLIWLSQLCIEIIDFGADITRHGKQGSIDPGTLSQCTGFADKNGRMIFFGDAYPDDGSMWVVFENDGAISALSNEGWVDSLTDLGRLSGIEITGNIHETEVAK